MTCCSVTSLTLLCNSLAYFRVLDGIVERQVLYGPESCETDGILLRSM